MLKHAFSFGDSGSPYISSTPAHLVISVHHIYLRHAPSFGGSEHHNYRFAIYLKYTGSAGSSNIVVVVVAAAAAAVVVVVVVCFGHRCVYDVRPRSHITGGTICYWHRPVYVARSHITAGTICCRHRRVFVVSSHITGGDLLRASARVCCEITPHVGYGLLRASACVCCEITRHGGYDLLRASACVCCEITHHGGYDLLRVSVVRSHITGGVIVTSIGVCMLALPSPGHKMSTSTWCQTQTFNAFKS